MGKVYLGNNLLYNIALRPSCEESIIHALQFHELEHSWEEGNKNLYDKNNNTNRIGWKSELFFL